MAILTVAAIIIGAITFALELVGYLIFTTTALTMLKVIFYISLAVIIILIVLFFFGIYEESPAAWASSLIMGIVLIVMGIITLASGRLAYKTYIVSEQYGVVYAETKTDYLVLKIEDKVEDVYIMTSIDGKTVTSIRKNAAKGNEKLKTLTFEEGDLYIGAKAFKDCGRLGIIKFADNSTYEFDEHVFEGCIRLEEINVGSAEIYNLNVPDSSKATVTINGGHFSTSTLLNTVFINNNQSSFRSKENNPKTVVFADGFEFGNGTYYSYYTTGIFTTTEHCVSVGKTIYLPASITKIPDYFFGNEGDKCTVHFAGTQEQWNNLNIGANGNSNYTNGNVKFEYNSSYSN